MLHVVRILSLVIELKKVVAPTCTCTCTTKQLITCTYTSGGNQNTYTNSYIYHTLISCREGGADYSIVFTNFEGHHACEQ